MQEAGSDQAVVLPVHNNFFHLKCIAVVKFTVFKSPVRNVYIRRDDQQAEYLCNCHNRLLLREK